MKNLKFAENLVPLVLSGEKTSTWRLFDDKGLKVGDKLIFINKGDGKRFATAEIVLIKEKTLGNIEDSDFSGHEKFGSKEEMFKTYQSYYGDAVNKNSIVKMIKFKLVE